MEKTVKIELTMEHLNVMMSALSELPIKNAINTFMEIQSQIDKQLSKPNAEGPLSNKIVN